ncbi:hypothetical protein [Devosia sp. SL43]|uniref:hypothetical protein n=1 Tax=Devosia sp. SL43 TaxID=2806348 RepID=UPI001F3E7C93|nr:hypothetical protein [Devosia sp. SL43]UJW86905.1 hypothetical protein IM737_06575 [Devosia sp. SL43]
MQQFLADLNTNANLITAAATAILAILTGILWFENRSLRKAGSSPEVVAYLLPHPDGHGGVHFILANVGRGPAFKVAFEFLYDEEDFKAHDALLLNDAERTAIAVLPQDEKIKALIGISFRLYGQVDKADIGPLKPFTVRITYQDVFGSKLKRENIIDIRQFAGLLGVLEKSNERKVSQSLEDIEKHLAAIARQSARFSAFVDTTQMADTYVQKAKGGE